MQNDSFTNILSGKKILIPVAIGMVVALGMLFHDIHSSNISRLTLTPDWGWALLAAVALIMGREAGYILRYRMLSDHSLSWRQSFRITMMCEFASTITPSSVGGSSLAMLFMKRENVDMGRGTSIVLITLFLDELFFVVTCPLIFIFIPGHWLFATLGSGIRISFWCIYGLVSLWTVMLYLGIFIKPRFIKSMIMWIFRLRLLRKWQSGASKFCEDLVATSIALRRKNIIWWSRAFLATAISWICRYALVGAIFWAIIPNPNTALILARQAVVWLILIIVPTPGGSGVSEWLFARYYADMVTSHGASLLIALIWRVFTYYLYIITGLLVIPGWLKPKSKVTGKAGL